MGARGGPGRKLKILTNSKIWLAEFGLVKRFNQILTEKGRTNVRPVFGIIRQNFPLPFLPLPFLSVPYLSPFLLLSLPFLRLSFLPFPWMRIVCLAKSIWEKCSEQSSLARKPEAKRSSKIAWSLFAKGSLLFSFPSNREMTSSKVKNSGRRLLFWGPLTPSKGLLSKLWTLTR